MVKRPLLLKGRFCKLVGWKTSIADIVSHDTSSDWKLQNFKFAAIETSESSLIFVNYKLTYLLALEEGNIVEDAARLTQTGKIAVWVYRKSNLRLSTRIPNDYSFKAQLEGAVHEKALKGQAKSHGTA